MILEINLLDDNGNLIQGHRKFLDNKIGMIEFLNEMMPDFDAQMSLVELGPDGKYKLKDNLLAKKG